MRLTPAAVLQTGHGWRMDNGVLSSPGKKVAILPLPGNLSGTSYQVQLGTVTPIHLPTG